MPRLDSWLRSSIFTLAAILILLAVLDGWLSRSAVPFHDAWDGAVGFLMRFEEDASALLAQHNEHRLVTTRLLVWVDFQFFGGRDIFLVATNYLFAAANWAILWSCLKAINGDRVAPPDLRLMGAMLAAWVFFWSQDVNFTWGFQHQVHGAQFFPLLAFLMLSHAAQRGPREHVFFVAALSLGIISAGTMANGALALALMAVWGIVLRMRVWQILTQAAAGALILFLYFQEFRTPGTHDSVVSSVVSHPFEILIFVFGYLGNPLVHVLSNNPAVRALAGFFGAILVAATLVQTFHHVRNRSDSKVIPGLLLYIIYVGATAFITAGGRALTFEHIAFAGRYTTPTVLAWAALVCILSPQIFQFYYSSRNYARWILMFANFLLVAMFVPAIYYFAPDKDYHHDQSVAVLALELRVADAEKIQLVYPNVQAVMNTAARASDQDLGIFAQTAYRGLRELIGQQVPDDAGQTCTAQIDPPINLPSHADHVRITGTLKGVRSGNAGTRVLIRDPSGIIVGAALTRRPERTRYLSEGDPARVADYTGYVRAEAMNDPLVFISSVCAPGD